jgi:hypothetical protein
MGAIGSQFGGDFILVLVFGGSAIVAAIAGYVGLSRATYRWFAGRVLHQSVERDDGMLKASLLMLGYAAIVFSVMFS